MPCPWLASLGLKPLQFDHCLSVPPTPALQPPTPTPPLHHPALPSGTLGRSRQHPNSLLIPTFFWLVGNTWCGFMKQVSQYLGIDMSLQVGRVPKSWVVMSKFSSVWCFTLFPWTANWTEGLVQVILVNCGLNARFSSNFGPVLVLGSWNQEPNLYIFWKMSMNMKNKLKHLKLIVRCLLRIQGHHKCIQGGQLAQAAEIPWPQIFLSSAYLQSWSHHTSYKQSTARISVLKNLNVWCWSPWLESCPIPFWVLDHGITPMSHD